MMRTKRSKNIITVVEVLFVLILCAVSQSYAWTMTADFEGGTNGSLAQGTSGFTYAGSATTISSDRSAKGTKSAKMVWPSGSEGWGIDHGEMIYPQQAINGQEIWARGYFYFSPPWDWSNGSAAQFIKILRIHIANSSGGNVGYHSLIANGSGNIISSNEVSDYGPILNVNYDTGRWQCLEIYVKLSATTPIIRMWKDGVLIFEDTTRKTLSSSGDYANFTYVMTQWNNGAPQNQTQYVDDFIITTDRPSQFDSKGNPMIGMIGGSSTPAVTPPTGLKVISK